VQDGAGAELTELALEAKTDSFLVNFAEPQCGHFVPFQSLDRTKTSLSFSHPLQ